MATSFSQLPIVDVGALKTSHFAPDDTRALSKQLYDVFATTGFAYLVNIPLSFTHEELFDPSQELFSLPASEKMNLAKQTFRPTNSNTYRGYFPTQPRLALDNLI
jgi:isopenicillin N synthase-like dioxygenase